MTHFEKIKAMDIDQMAEFIEDCGTYGGFTDMACRECIHRRPDGRCAADDVRRGCKDATRILLEQEVTDDATRENESPVE